jgi:hypothetical protein
VARKSWIVWSIRCSTSKKLPPGLPNGVHAREAPVSAASEPVAPLEDADAPFAAAPPFECRSHGGRAAFPPLPRQDHRPHAVRVRGALVRPGGKARVGDRQAGGAAEELLVPDQRGDPQGLIRHPSLADLIVRDELRLGFLDLHQLAKLRRFHRLALADRLGVRLEEAQELLKTAMRFPSTSTNFPDPGGISAVDATFTSLPITPPSALEPP